MKNNCPICTNSSIESVFKSDVPVLQNRVYKTIEEAKASSKGVVDLTHCPVCNFTFNAAFDNEIIVYDENYDNAVPSQLFLNYYISICNYLFEKYNLEQGVVYDIGCGKGTFLFELCKLYPSVKAIGIDPSYEGNLNPLPNLTFIQDFFKEEHVVDSPSLILSRHVFEHIEYPKDFLKIIYNPISKLSNVPVFIEVPDFGWIVENKTFWDICYEHCNYFSMQSIQHMFKNDWSILKSITPSFGNQYLWVEGVFNSSSDSENHQIQFPEIPKTEILEYVNSIHMAMDKIKNCVLEFKSSGYQTVVWGMATKGVIFTNLLDQTKELIDFCIDINKEKQHKYTPISAHLILPPITLQSESTSKLLIIVMNTNYLQEIKAEVLSYNIEANFIDAHGVQL